MPLLLRLNNIPNTSNVIANHVRSISQKMLGCSSTEAKVLAIQDFFRSSYDDYQRSIFQAARIVRKEIKAQEKWQFSGSFDWFNIPRSLQLLLSCIGGPRASACASPYRKIDKSVEILSEFMINVIKSDRQMYHATKKKEYRYRQINETVGLGLHLYKATRSKDLIEQLSNLNLCISY